jgi:hypothetical protein
MKSRRNVGRGMDLQDATNNIQQPSIILLKRRHCKRRDMLLRTTSNLGIRGGKQNSDKWEHGGIRRAQLAG